MDPKVKQEHAAVDKEERVPVDRMVEDVCAAVDIFVGTFLFGQILTKNGFEFEFTNSEVSSINFFFGQILTKNGYEFEF